MAICDITFTPSACLQFPTVGRTAILELFGLKISLNSEDLKGLCLHGIY